MRSDPPFTPDFRSLVDAQSELISLARPDGELVYVNAAYSRHYGRTVQQLLGSNLFEMIPPEEREAVRVLISNVLRTGEIGEGENRIVGPDGSQQWMAWTNSRHFGGGGEPLLHSVGRDITQRRAAEAALRDSQLLLERTGRTAGVGGWQLDLRTSELTWTAQTRRIHEVADDYLPTMETAIEFYAPEARSAIETAVQAGIREGKPWDLEMPLITATGRRVWVRAVGGLELENGTPARLVGSFQDIDERRRLRQRVVESECFMRQVTDNVPVRIAYVDRERRYQFVNQAHCDRFGLPREQIIGRTRSEFSGGVDDEPIDPHVEAVLEGVAQHYEFDETAGGATRRIEARLLPDRDQGGRVRGFFAIEIDVTQRHADERTLRDLTAILDASPDYVVQTDRRGDITYLNPAVRRELGLDSGAPLPQGLNFSRFNTPETNLRFAQTILPAVNSAGSWIGETTVLAADGRILPVSHLVIGHPDDQGRVARYSAVMRDISEQTRARRELERQRATLHSVAQAIPALVAVVGADLRYRFVNSAFERWVGSSKDGVIGRTVTQVIGRTDYERSKPWIDRVLAGETVNFEREYQTQGRPRHLAASYVPLWSADGTMDGFVGVLQDISRQREEHTRLVTLSQLDVLTGLLNRSGLQQALQQQISSGAGASLAVLYIDLDRFKPINDEHGHPVGDEVLKGFAQRLRGLVRPTDSVARLGGDEFVVLLPGVREAANADAVATKVVRSVEEPFEVGKLRLRVGTSVGVAHGLVDGDDGTELLARADMMLYRAKNSGRGKYTSDWGRSSP
jgi:diguanylate cyclase (GGDEF)-like protein/PAS domain S-box-containing protein